jgi:hypothetical protein
LGTHTLKRDRFVKVTDADPSLDWELVERAQQLVALKGRRATGRRAP